ncbi:MAG: CcoQ/FixQ family Cbb3-type cytochrome c oxidase assembly chaperone [Sandaracinaceae bacterium]|nr:CcoQ/FixQ family Cbb3-type cytochrome c oxidase assembly chaperone [Sandaracinaceae bacterium]
MSTIAHHFYTESPLLFLPLVALLIFVGVFAAVSIRAMTASRDSLDAAARLPLESDKDGTHE